MATNKEKLLLHDSKGLKVNSEEKIELVKKFELLELKEDLLRGIYEYGSKANFNKITLK